MSSSATTDPSPSSTISSPSSTSPSPSPSSSSSTPPMSTSSSSPRSTSTSSFSSSSTTTITTTPTTFSQPPDTTEPPSSIPPSTTTTSSSTSSTPRPRPARPPPARTTDDPDPPTSAPLSITSTFTSTRAGGGLMTITEIIANPTLSPDNPRHSGNGFFGNTGAVAAVFVLVGLAAASIALWVIFAVRRRRRHRRIERDTAAFASLATAGPHRPPLDDDDDDGPRLPPFTAPPVEITQRRSGSRPVSASYVGPITPYHDDPDLPDTFNPYAEYMYPVAPAPDGHNPRPPLAHLNNHDRSRRESANGSLTSAGGGPEGYGIANHSATHSGASYEPLMASFYRQSSGSGQQSNSPALTTPPAAALPFYTPPAYPSSQALVPLTDGRDSNDAHSLRTTDTTDDRLDPGLKRRQREADSASMKDLRDNEDYSRPVLGVRNP